MEQFRYYSCINFVSCFIIINDNIRANRIRQYRLFRTSQCNNNAKYTNKKVHPFPDQSFQYYKQYYQQTNKANQTLVYDYYYYRNGVLTLFVNSDDN